MDEKTIITVVLGIYIFVMLGVYFVLCVLGWDKVEAFGCAVLWIAFIIVGALYCPLWVIGKAADYVKAHIKWVDSKNQENNEDDPSDWEF